MNPRPFRTLEFRVALEFGASRFSALRHAQSRAVTLNKSEGGPQFRISHQSTNPPIHQPINARIKPSQGQSRSVKPKTRGAGPFGPSQNPNRPPFKSVILPKASGHSTGVYS